MRFASFTLLLLLLTTQASADAGVSVCPEFGGAGDLPAAGSGSIGESFSSRLRLRAAFAAQARQGGISPACAREVRDRLNELRSREDALGLVESGALQGVEPRRVFEGGYPYLQLNPAFAGESEGDALRLRSGDVLISRGGRLISAMIAKVTSPGGLFSHAALVYVDERTGERFTIESRIEGGTEVRPIEEYLTSKGSRVALFRHPDGALAQRAARHMFERAGGFPARKKKKPIPYDFAMDYGDHAKLYCAEVVTEGYEAASQGALRIPAFPSALDPGRAPVLRRLGIERRETFAPADMELEPEFELVAEWRQYSKLQESLRFDAILAEAYDWVATRGYDFDPTAGMSVAKWAAWGLRQAPVINRPLRKRFPKDMSVSVVEVLLSMTELSKRLMPVLAEREGERMAKLGRPLTPAELRHEVARLRDEDLQRFSDYRQWLERWHELEGRGVGPRPRKPLFHLFFHN